MLTAALFSCSGKKEIEKTGHPEPPVTSLSGNALAVAHCGRCHAFVSPALLQKSIWKNDVLPSMGHRLGIYKGDHQPDSLFASGPAGVIVRNANIFPEQPAVAKEDWKKIVDYYIANAPDTILPSKRIAKIQMGLKHFKYKEASYASRPPLTTMVKILQSSRGIVFSDGKRNNNTLTFLTPSLKKNYNVSLDGTPIHYYERSDTIFLTTAGKNVFPSEAAEGTIQKVFKKGPGQRYKMASIILSRLKRPVSMAYGDLNNDQLEDIVACEFGDLTGKLVWFENNGHYQYKERILRAVPGAITAIIRDAHNDGLNDIFVLMAQGDEGVFFYENKGNDTFIEKRLLSFLPLNGSQHIEVVDFNKDGFDDIVYTCGDNADRTPVLKKYHGIYIFLNDGKLNFKRSYFYPLNGAYKAIPGDYDLDGDLDIAAISFFPDYYSYPEESFIYLENRGNLKFEEYSFPEATKGRWIVMDAGDMDADGDLDLALGSFVFFTAQGDTTGLGKKWLSTGPSVVVLENTIR